MMGDFNMRANDGWNRSPAAPGVRKFSISAPLPEGWYTVFERDGFRCQAGDVGLCAFDLRVVGEGDEARTLCRRHEAMLSAVEQGRLL